MQRASRRTQRIQRTRPPINRFDTYSTSKTCKRFVLVSHISTRIIIVNADFASCWCVPTKKYTLLYGSSLFTRRRRQSDRPQTYCTPAGRLPTPRPPPGSFSFSLDCTEAPFTARAITLQLQTVHTCRSPLAYSTASTTYYKRPSASTYTRCPEIITAYF